MTLFALVLTAVLLPQNVVAAPSSTGVEPSESLEARDIISEYKLPPLTPTSTSLSHLDGTQVLSRAKRLQIDSRSATKAWFAAENTLQQARQRTVKMHDQTPVSFQGTLASELNVLIAKSDVSSIVVESSQLRIDTPIVIERAGLALNLDRAQLRDEASVPYMIRIVRAQHVSVHGGFLLAGRWAALISGSGDVAIDGMDIRDLSGGGILVTNSRDVTVSADSFHALRGAPILLHGDSERVTVIGNVISHNLGSSNWNAGIVLTDREVDLTMNPDALLTQGNYWPTEQAMKIRIHIPHDNVVAFNNVIGNASSGIYSDGSVRNVFVQNRIERNSKEGLCLDNGSLANVVAGNSLFSNGDRWGKSDSELRQDFVIQSGRLPDGTSPVKLPAISIDNAAYNQVMFNDIDRNFGGGVKMVRTSFYNIIGLNTVLDNNRGASNGFHFFGIEVGAAKPDAQSTELDFAPSCSNEIFGNIIRGSHYAGIFFADGSEQNNVFDNAIFGATSWAMESAKLQQNITLNNLTNIKLRNIDAGLDPRLLVTGRGQNDVPPPPPHARSNSH